MREVDVFLLRLAGEVDASSRVAEQPAVPYCDIENGTAVD